MAQVELIEVGGGGTGVSPPPCPAQLIHDADHGPAPRGPVQLGQYQPRDPHRAVELSGQVSRAYPVLNQSTFSAAYINVCSLDVLEG